MEPVVIVRYRTDRDKIPREIIDALIKSGGTVSILIRGRTLLDGKSYRFKVRPIEPEIFTAIMGEYSRCISTSIESEGRRLRER